MPNGVRKQHGSISTPACSMRNLLRGTPLMCQTRHRGGQGAARGALRTAADELLSTGLVRESVILYSTSARLSPMIDPTTAGECSSLSPEP